MEALVQIVDYLVSFFGKSTVTVGLFVFPPLIIALKILSGRTKSFRDYLPTKGLLYSFGNNLVLMLINVAVWVTILAGVQAVLNTFWQDIFGLVRPKVFAELPFLAQFILLLFLLDFKNYWSHRLLHRPWMWGIHSLHHSDEHMNFSTAFRVHGLEFLQMTLVAVIFVGWMDLPVTAFGAAVLTRTWYSMYIHSRLPFDHGRFRRVLISPNYHRWHHADDSAVYGKNLGDMFPIWDIIFKTHYDPGTCDIPQGVSDAPSDVIRAQVFPVIYLGRLFRKRKLKSS